MKTRLTLKPGQHGTKSLVKKYGDALVCVRFRYDPETKQRLKTVELIVERSDWTPPAPRFTNDTLVPLRIKATEVAIRNKVKAVGGRWNPERKLWFVTYGNIVGTQLEKYIDVDGFG
ncbi:hypothetical protein [Geobacter pickeringii]|uniref:Uncharacterized protein n=1 Tax=Geobacter pickeringii TaxID=345632 RepID=A0A0B5B824_9BACT|nr:hypothetical protein [Geobacter pickeringii]AJE02707.1 hypothetical protein GPICK_04380 [Geobacter pickeringii]